jgi:2'-5' RNA ligase
VLITGLCAFVRVCQSPLSCQDGRIPAGALTARIIGMLRLFFALWPGPETRDALAAAASGLRLGSARRVPSANLHVTLAFLGGTTAEDVPRVEAAAAGVQSPPFELVLDRFGCWPAAHIAWLGAGREPAELAALSAALRARLQAAGIAFDRKPFRCHVTLARRVPVLSQPLPAVRIRWRIDSFALVSSLRGPAGSCYEVLAAWSLAVPGPGAAER